MSRIALFLCGLLTIATLLVMSDTADAARIGGGRSFGGRSFMTRPTTPPPSFSQPRANRAQQQPGMAAQRPGMGGIFGGLLAGTLLGSLFGGGGMGGGILNLLILGGLAYMAFRLFARMRSARDQQPSRHADATENNAFNGLRYQTASNRSGPTPRTGPDWSTLAGSGTATPTPAAATADEDSHVLKEKMAAMNGTFDEQDFLKGAKAAYARLNAAWDRRDLNDIAAFSTPAFMNDIRQQAAADPTPGNTEILLVDARLVDLREDQGDQLASVFFNVVLREDPNQSASTDVREIWHFTRKADGTGNWKLDGIQQVEM